ncbi:hypothetical protein DFS33DRAFT_1336563 [Desarmillaria ectypa]|nr:hypothetical protein DFS33DRAFT_1336563 [Desarmillaria ectypa]
MACKAGCDTSAWQPSPNASLVAFVKVFVATVASCRPRCWEWNQRMRHICSSAGTAFKSHDLTMSMCMYVLSEGPHPAGATLNWFGPKSIWYHSTSMCSTNSG